MFAEHTSILAAQLHNRQSKKFWRVLADFTLPFRVSLRLGTVVPIGLRWPTHKKEDSYSCLPRMGIA